MTVEAAARCPIGSVEVGRFHLSDALDGPLRTGPGYWLDMCLTERPPNARARYLDRWGAHRFEPVGSLFLAHDREPIHVRSEPGEGVAIVAQLDAEAISSWSEGSLKWTDHWLEMSLDIRCGAVRRLLQKIACELRDPGFAHSFLIESMLMQVAIELHRYCSRIETQQGAGAGLAPWRLRKIDELAESGTVPSLGEVADLCNMSVRQLTRAFRVSRGCSIAAFFAQKRLECGRRMISEGRSIKSVASALGFSSQSSFTYSFRKSVGLTPVQFREALARTIVS